MGHKGKVEWKLNYIYESTKLNLKSGLNDTMAHMGWMETKLNYQKITENICHLGMIQRGVKTKLNSKSCIINYVSIILYLKLILKLILHFRP